MTALSKVGLIIVCAVAIATLMAILEAPSMVYEPPFLLPILNTIFLSAMLFIVVFVSAKAYLQAGSMRLLLLGAGVLVLGFSSLVAGWIIFIGGPNANVTVYNTGVFAASIPFVLSSAFSAGNRASPQGDRGMGLLAAYAGVIIFEGLLTYGTLRHSIPVFFVQGVGPTPIRQMVLGMGTILFACTAIVLWRLYTKYKSSIVYWYSLGLALITVGLVAVFFQMNVGSVLGWVGRSAQYLGSLYLLISVLAAKRSLAAMPKPKERATG